MNEAYQQIALAEKVKQEQKAKAYKYAVVTLSQITKLFEHGSGFTNSEAVHIIKRDMDKIKAVLTACQ